MPRNILESGGALRLTEPRSLRAAGFMVPMRGPLWVVEAPQAHRHRLALGAPAHRAVPRARRPDHPRGHRRGQRRRTGLLPPERLRPGTAPRLSVAKPGRPSAHRRTPQLGTQRAGRLGQSGMAQRIIATACANAGNRISRAPAPPVPAGKAPEEGCPTGMVSGVAPDCPRCRLSGSKWPLTQGCARPKKGPPAKPIVQTTQARP